MVLVAATLNLNGVLRLATSRMNGLPARKEVTMSSCNSWRWKSGVEAMAERDMVTFWGETGEKEGYVWRVFL